MKAFRIIGKYTMNRRFINFTKETVCESKEIAMEKIYSEIGSKHRIKRKMISIGSIREISPEEIENLYVREMLGAVDGK